MSARTARTNRRSAASAPAGQGARSRLRIGAAALVAGAVAIVGLWALTGRGGNGGTSANVGAYPYAVGSPGPGKAAPQVLLPSTAGGTFDLAAYRGRQVLLYFQEGLTCQPCWDQIAAIQKERAKFRVLGIGTIVSVTTDPLSLIAQKARDDGLTIPVLSDSGGRVSDAYDARSYAMMGHARDGHTFVLVGRDGRIRWRADYGGPPKYTMFVPVDTLLAQLRSGAEGAA